LKSKRDPELFVKSQQQLKELAQQAAQKQIDLYYFDESGFTLEPCIPYAWQAIGENIKVPCSSPFKVIFRRKYTLFEELK
jgi:hypothetical protein